jgi:hypothetical protein
MEGMNAHCDGVVFGHEDEPFKWLRPILSWKKSDGG